MEDIKTYIESGILELYVLGDLNAEEKAAVEAMSKLHPEVKAELEEIEKVMMDVSLNLAIEPSLKVKENFFSQLTFSDEEQVVEPVIKSVVTEAKVVPLSKVANFYKYSFAACLALLVVSIVAIVNLSSSLKNSRKQIAQLQSSNQTFANQVNYLDKKVYSTNQSIKVLTNPDFKMVNLKGTDNSPSSNIMVAFNSKEQKVMLDFTNMKMPKNDEQHQYQLWALVDGKPVDLGVFDMEEGEIGLKDMKSIGTAQTFAVTLEPRGGSVSPTLEKLMVIGNI
ncbi:anti-sigma factor [Pedobacter arcticus]|uniref:anti-sigma factor n=1 Tax=Pedobacter arcticus TaxID=752140 RepID=UPI000306B0F1|nr:anti-sigma factor [Pedobacter arcticus]